MGSESRPLQSKDIFHNLPTFDPSIINLKAIVTGANGISGFHTIRALLSSPERWSKIYALSRSPIPQSMLSLLPDDQVKKIEHVPIDLQESSEKIAGALNTASVEADYVFYYAYLQPRPPADQPIWSNAEELTSVNSHMFSNFLDALSLMPSKPKRVVLQTGAKNYGVHLGRTRFPALESDPQPRHLDSNFYYPQEDALFAWCKKENAEWNVIRPAWVVGAVSRAQINAFYPLAVYAAVQAHLNRPLRFPGDWSTWQHEFHHSTAYLTGYLTEWAALTPSCANHAFNAQDTCPISWDLLYSELARWFSPSSSSTSSSSPQEPQPLPITGPPPDTDSDSAYAAITEGRSGAATPYGSGPPIITRVAFGFAAWAKDSENHAAWKEIVAQSGGAITVDPFDDPDEYFAMCDVAHAKLGCLSMTKARRMGWSGWVDTREAVFMMYKEMAVLGMLPEMKVREARPMV